MTQGPSDAPRRPSRARERRASYLVLFVVMVAMLIGFAAIAVDLGILYLADSELGVATDAAAVAGASQIDGTGPGIAKARASAQSLAALNEVRNEAVGTPTQVLTFGLWNPETRTFSASTVPEEINAIRVESTWKDVPTPFASFAFGRATSDVHATAIAVRPPGEPAGYTGCFLPVAIPKCVPDDVEAGGLPYRKFQLSNDSNDTIAWAFPGGVNAQNVSDALAAAARGECLTKMVKVGDPIDLQNGVVASNLHLLRDLLRNNDDLWDDELWGPKPPQDPYSSFPPVQYPTTGTIQGAVPVIADGGNCSAVKFTQSAPIVQLTWGVIFDVYDGPGQHKGIQVFVDLEHDFDVPGGGTGPGNVTYRPPGRLVE